MFFSTFMVHNGNECYYYKWLPHNWIFHKCEYLRLLIIYNFIYPACSFHLYKTFFFYCFSGMMNYLWPLWKLLNHHGAWIPSSSVPISLHLPGRVQNPDSLHNSNVLILPTINWAPSLWDCCVSAFPVIPKHSGRDTSIAILEIGKLRQCQFCVFNEGHTAISGATRFQTQIFPHQSLYVAFLILCLTCYRQTGYMRVYTSPEGTKVHFFLMNV